MLPRNFTISERLTALEPLYGIASDFEADILNDLARRAGWTWSCPACRDDNPMDELTCNCGEPRPEKQP